MTRFRVASIATLGCAVAVATSVFAQQNTERRERLRGVVEAAAGVAVDMAEKARAEVVSGNVITLQGKPREAAKEVNVGGLVIVRVADTGSRPSADLSVNAGRQFQRLGQVRGVRQQRGEPKAGFTLVLLKPLNEGDGTIAVSYTPNDGGAAVRHDYKVTVTAAGSDVP